MKIPPKRPQFFKPIQKGFKNGLKIPIGFLKYLKGQDHIEHAILRRAGTTWLVKVNGWRLEEGWKKFVKENDLQLGDLLIFKHEGDMEFEVSIFDSSHCDREYAEFVQQETGCNNFEETSKNFEFKGKSNLCIGSSDKAFPCAEADKSNPNIMSTRKAFLKEESATYSSFHQSHLVCIVRPYCLSRNYLRLPQRFSRANGLVNKKCGIVIRDERQRSWNLRLDSYGSGVYIAEGWRKFCVENDLKEGDCMMFEVVTNEEKPIWKFHGTATHNPFDQSHFVCITRPYCLMNDFLYIPTKFALANGLTNKKGDMIIRDERERSWNVKLCSFGNSVCIKGGWHEFRDANCLKEGDCIMFEVVSNGERTI